MSFDKFAKEDLWALSSLRAFLFDEYRNAPYPEKLSPTIILLLQQFDRHMSAAQKAGKISIITFTNNAFAMVSQWKRWNENCMGKELQKKIEELKTSSALAFKEIEENLRPDNLEEFLK